MARQYNNYTEQEEQYLKEHYANAFTSEIAEKLGRTCASVHWKASSLGLKKSKEIKKKQGQIAAMAFYDEISKTWFAKGSKPYNKGKKQTEYMTKESIERTAVTRFKKGQLPHNTQRDGAISLRDYKKGPGYYFIRINVAKWVPLHRHLWEQANGTLPKGAVIRFKDGNTRNCVLENLELVDRAGNMLKNTIWQYPADVRENIKLVNKINKIIKEHENTHAKDE